ncbi:MAG TPA: phosphoglycerate kinase [Candidatus Paceibacterota bacterium]|jgi:phosphoglycerate kinase|nr:phosphoglycerate kinase [Candidatus Paceibacterota bacterium]
MQEITGVKSVRDADVAGKRVLVAVDFNVPLKDGAIVDDARIRAALPTLELLRGRKAKVVVMTHLGRPDGKEVEGLRVAPLARRLGELMHEQVTVAPQESDFMMLENLRFDPREEEGSAELAQELATFGDLYVNEAFSNSHRDHASIVGVPKLLPSFAGVRLMEEIEHLNEALTPPQGAVAIVGGAKFETKQPLIEKLMPHYARILLGGALGNDVIKARGLPVGASLVSSVPASVELAGDDKLAVTTDAVMEKEESKEARTGLVVDVRANERIVDVGPVTAAAWAQVVEDAPFVLWNGPLGIYEQGYTDASDIVARALAKSQARAVVGGGDTEAALKKYSFDPVRVYLSTGGGAMLEFLTAGTLPGIEALKVAPK